MSRCAPVRRAVSAAVVALCVVTGCSVGGVDTSSTTGAQSAGQGLALATPVLSGRRAPDLLAQRSAQQALSLGLEQVLAQAPPDTCLVVTTDAGVLFTRNGDLPLTPASAMKLLTAAVAMEVLGPDHRFATEVRSPVGAIDGVLDADIHLVGGGDPLLTTSGYAASLPDPLVRLTSPLEQLADATVAAGISRVTGSVVGDGSRYDDAVGVASWPASYRVGPTVGSLGALRVNAGREGWADDPAAVTIGGNGGNPAQLAAQTFTQLLRDRGVIVDGEPGVGSAPEDATKVAGMLSPPLAEVMDELLAWSDNGAAELLVKELGLVVSGQPTTAAGTNVLATTIASWGLATDGITIVDGSGLDPGNRLTCTVLAGLVARPASNSPLLNGLARPGSAGTLWGRLTASSAPGRVRAKTGTLDTVRSLTGDVASASQGPLRFAFIANGPASAPGLSHDIADAAVRVLLDHPRGPDPADLAPLPPTPLA